jgi:hypothetical protein
MMNSVFSLPEGRIRGIAGSLILLLLSGPLAQPAAALGSAAANDELPAAPSARLQLQGTLASMHVAPSKLDQGPAQTPAPPPPALQIAILEGEDVSNNIKERTAREPIVQVTDENHKPVGGAAVLFTIQNGSNRAGASFLHGAKTFSGTTDAEGKITARGFHPNGHTGQFHINVTASKGQLNTHTVIAQTNVAAATTAATTATIPAFVATHVVLVSAVAAGVVAAGVATGVALTQNNGTTITPGTGTVGAPQAAISLRTGVHR